MTSTAIPIIRYRFIFSSLRALSSIVVAILLTSLPCQITNNKNRVIAERMTMIDVSCSVLFNAFSNLSAAVDALAN